MKKILLLLIFAIARIHAQDYQISFAGTGASMNVDSVKVENLSQCKVTSFGGNNILHLTSTTTGINETSKPDNSLHIFPNPISGTCSIDFYSPEQGNATIELDNITGDRIVKVSELLPQGNHQYRLNGISSGVYMLKIESEKYSYSSKIVSINSESGVPEIQHFEINSGTNTQSIGNYTGCKLTI